MALTLPPLPAGDLTQLLADQAGVVARRQLAAAGLAPHDVRRLLRRRDLVRLHPGVYVAHTGRTSWEERAWGAVLALWPAVLAGASALRAAEGPGAPDDGRIHLAVDRQRHVQAPAGVVVSRRSRLTRETLWHPGPPRLRYEVAVLDTALAAATELGAVDEVARAVQARRTTAARLAEALAARPRAPRRAWLDEVLRDVAGGTTSVLEHAYLHRVERPHGLPQGRRQARHRVEGGVVYRDVEYPLPGGGHVVVELDGQLVHGSLRARARDHERDLWLAMGGTPTVRLTYGQVVGQPCRTAHRLGVVLSVHGWHGEARSCGVGCRP